MDELYTRTAALIGMDKLARLKTARVAVFGCGGVGGYVVECLARAGIGVLDVVDNDTVSESNRNRQIIALSSTVGKKKVTVIKERITDINPAVIVHPYDVFFLPETSHQFDFSVYDYVVDAVDTVTAKIAIVEQARECNVPVISCMGTGNKRNPQLLTVADISKTSVCPLARVMRHELKKRGIAHLKTVYSTEPPFCTNAMILNTVESKSLQSDDSALHNKQVPASISFVPAAAGILIASEVINDLIQ